MYPTSSLQAAVEAVTSDVLTGGDPLQIAIEYAVLEQPNHANQATTPPSAPVLPGGAALWLRADDLASILKAGEPVVEWKGANKTASATAGAGGAPTPTFSPAAGGTPASVRHPEAYLS